jgi:hypothetical protein
LKLSSVGAVFQLNIHFLGLKPREKEGFEAEEPKPWGSLKPTPATPPSLRFGMTTLRFKRPIT